MAGFSSQGPTHGDLLIKPDVVAPGADIVSSFPQHHCDPLPPEGCWSFLGGTSMATPHLAGTAAVVRGDHPNWTAAQVRSAIVNTAQEGLLRHPETGVVTDDARSSGPAWSTSRPRWTLSRHSPRSARPSATFRAGRAVRAPRPS